MSRKFEHVAVLMGGWSSEREVSLASGEACAKALEGEGYRVSQVDVTPQISEVLGELKPDVCFNALHGRWGEDGCVQGILETLSIPYTHSGVLASALAMHKERAKTVLKAAGVPVAESVVVSIEEAARSHVMEPPYVLKPVEEGSSVGIYIVKEGMEVPREALLANEAIANAAMMVERFIPGRELTCSVFGDEVFDIIEILPAEGLEFYDYEAKYAPGGSKHVLPAKILPNIYQTIRKLTLEAHKALGCRGVSRTDFRFNEESDGTGELICLEVNTQPGMTATSLVPELAAFKGWSFGDLVRRIVEDASCNR